MSLITTPIGASRTAPVMSPEQKAMLKAAKLASLRQRVLDKARYALEAYDRINKEGIALVHEDPDFTPEEGLAALGDSAQTICLGSRFASEHIAEQANRAGTTYVPPVFSPASEAALSALFAPQ